MAKHQDKLPQSPPGAWRRGMAERKGANLRSLGLENPSWLPADSPETTTPATPSTSVKTAELVGSDTPTRAVEPAVRAVLEGMKVVCICKGIKQRTFWQAMEKGSQTQEAVNRETGSGSGGCRGRRCGPRIAAMLHEKTLHKP